MTGASSAIGARVGPATFSSARSAPRASRELTPEEKLLHAIFGRAGEDVKNDSLEVPAGTERHRHRHASLQSAHAPQSDDQKKASLKDDMRTTRKR